MFGNIFDEGSPGYGPFNKHQSSVRDEKGKEISLPPSLRGKQKLIGIKNQGATCYLNSLIQTLFLTPEFRDSLFSLGRDELGSITAEKDPSNNDVQARKIPLQLQLLFSRLLLLDQDSINAENLTDSFGWNNSEQTEQHDVQELCRILFDAIETSLKGTSGCQLINNLFRGSTIDYIKCLKCDNVSERESQFLDVMVSVTSMKSLHETLRGMYEHEESLSGKNQYSCAKCSTLVDAKMGAKIKDLPPILTFSLLRFNFDFRTNTRCKQTGFYEFPYVLEMAPYCQGKDKDADTDEDCCTSYVLYSVIVHSGSAHSGHYIAYIQDVDGLGFSDIPISQTESISQASTSADDTTTDDSSQQQPASVQPPTVLPEVPPPPPSIHSPPTAIIKKSLGRHSEMEDPQVVLKRIITEHGSVKLDELAQLFRANVGQSWTKRYRKTYGTLKQFLYGNKSVFRVNDDSVSIAEISKLSSSDVNATIDAIYEQSEKGGPLDSNMIADLANLGLTNGGGGGGYANAAAGCSNDTMRECTNNFINDATSAHEHGGIVHVPRPWFKFNDSTVTAVDASEIPKQFSGQQSAYMLFYRRRDLIREESGGCGSNLASKLPDQMRKIMEVEGKYMNKWRMKYDEALNRLNLYIHVESSCYFQQGLMRTKNKDGFLLRVDRRQTVSSLLEEITKMVPKHQTKPSSRKTVYLGKETAPAAAVSSSSSDEIKQLHAMKVLSHGGLHLLKCISENMEMTLKDLDLEDDSHVFAWNGDMVSSVEVAVGLPYEPLLIHMTHKDARGFSVNLTFTVSRSDKKVVLWETACKMLHLKSFEDLHLKALRHTNDEKGGVEEYFTVITELDATFDDFGCEETIIIEQNNHHHLSNGHSYGGHPIPAADLNVSFKYDDWGEPIQDRTNEDGEATAAADSPTLDSVTVKVKNLTSTLESGDCCNDLLLEYNVPTKKTMQSLKEDITKFLSLDKSSTVRLCKPVDVGFHLPFLPDSTVATHADFIKDNCLLLEHGKQLTKKDIVVFVKGFQVLQCQEIVVQTSTKFSVFCKDLFKRFSVQGDEWHLKRCNIYGDTSTPIDNIDKTVLDSGIKHGDFIAIVSGKLLERGALRIPIWLYPPPRPLDASCYQTIRPKPEPPRRRVQYPLYTTSPHHISGYNMIRHHSFRAELEGDVDYYGAIHGNGIRGHSATYGRRFRGQVPCYDDDGRGGGRKSRLLLQNERYEEALLHKIDMHQERKKELSTELHRLQRDEVLARSRERRLQQRHQKPSPIQQVDDYYFFFDPDKGFLVAPTSVYEKQREINRLRNAEDRVIRELQLALWRLREKNYQDRQEEEQERQIIRSLYGDSYDEYLPQDDDSDDDGGEMVIEEEEQFVDVDNNKEQQQVPRYIDNVEVKRDEQLYDLSHKINQLIETVANTGDAELRYRIVEKSHLTRVLPMNNHESTVKRLKLPNSCQIAVQPVYTQVKANAVSLNVYLHKPGTRTYDTSPYELLMDDGYRSLHDEISKATGIGIAEFIVARKSIDKHSWEVITREKNVGGGKNKATKSSKKGGKKGGKKKQAASGGAGSPSICYNDGDVIGLKFIYEEESCDHPIDLADFDSEGDIAMRNKMEENAKLRNAGMMPQVQTEDDDWEEEALAVTQSPSLTKRRGGVSAGGTATRRGEKGLRIHVETYHDDSNNAATATNAAEDDQNS